MPLPTRAKILDSALALTDRRGLKGLTLRALSAHAGLPVMSLYSRFENKEHLRQLMFEEIVNRLFDGVGMRSWREEIRGGCNRARALLAEHPNWLPLLTSVSVPPLTVGLYDRLLELMLADGFRTEDVMLAVSSAMSFTLGSVLVERMMSARREGAIPRRQLALVKGPLIESSPRLVEAASKFDEWSFEAVFDAGLESLLRGIEASRLPRATSTVA